MTAPQGRPGALGRSTGLTRGAGACVAAVAWARNRQLYLPLRRTPRPRLTVKPHRWGQHPDVGGARTSSAVSSSANRGGRGGELLALGRAATRAASMAGSVL